MKILLPVLFVALFPGVVLAGGDSGWAERGNGNDYVPPQCVRDASPDHHSILPRPPGDEFSNERAPWDTECQNHAENPSIGRGQLKVNN